jgi:serine/threonine-protein kinase
MSMAQVREILAGRYELLAVLGRGGMGVVYRAHDDVLGRVVAIKVLPADRAEDPVFVARFEREARAAAALNHPNIVAVFDSGRDPETRFIVMEYVPGASLAQLLRQRGRLPAGEAVEIAVQIASALSAAHRAGIIHRDIKPGNVMVDERSKVKVLDFGIARAVAATSLTNAAMVLGSASYMAPEVTLGETADERSDIYSLGCVLYEMLSGRPPFTGELSAAIMHQHNAARPRPLRTLDPTTPAALDALVLQMLAKERNERPRRAEQLVDLLPASLEDRTAATLVRPTTRATRSTEATRALRRRWAGRERIALAVAVALLLIAVAVGASGSSSPTRRAAASKPRTSTAPRSTPPSASAKARTTATPTTVAGAAGRLTSLVTADLQSGAIDQQARQQILGALQDILNSYNGGKPSDALHKVNDLTTQLAQLSSHADIKASALPALSAAIASLGSALAQGAPSSPAPGGPPAKPAGGPAAGHHGKHGKHGKD